jgi:uncharacterized membrane protein
MNKKKKLLFIVGIILVLVGALLKINKTSNVYVYNSILLIGMLTELLAIVLLIFAKSKKR